MKRFAVLPSLLLAVFLIFPTVGLSAGQDDAEQDNIPYVHIPSVENLEQLGKRSTERKLPILLVVSQSGCSYCELLKAEIIRPMILSGDYEDRVLIRELNLDAGEQVTDFNGVRRSSQDVASDYQAWVTPTLLFLDGRGKPLAKKIRGVNTIEMLSFYVDESIQTSARQMMR